MGLAGNGTPLHPYLIEDLYIQNNHSYFGDYCIKIQYTNAHFVIRNCILEMEGHDWGNAIWLYNVTNGRIENCSIIVNKYGNDYRPDGIEIDTASNVEIRNCSFMGGEDGLSLYRCSDCIIESNLFADQMDDTINLILSNFTDVSENILMGAGRIYSHTGINLKGYSSNCVIVGNAITNYWSAGIRVAHSADNLVLGNNVSRSGFGILLDQTNQSQLENNLLTLNIKGIYLHDGSYYNSITQNILSNNETNAQDDGFENTWQSNWYSDFGAGTTYFIEGSAHSLDRSPLPKSLHIPGIISMSMILLLIGMIPIALVIQRQMSRGKNDDDRLTKRYSLYFIIFSVLLPCGISTTPFSNSLLPNLKYVLVDALCALGISRIPGTDWTINYFSVHDYLLSVVLPYLAVCILSIALFIQYQRKKFSGTTLVGILIIATAIVIVISWMASVILKPFTPLLVTCFIFSSKLKKVESQQNLEQD